MKATYSDNNSYVLKLGDLPEWCLVGDSGTEAWVRRLATIMELHPGNGVSSPTVRFVRGELSETRKDRCNSIELGQVWDGHPRRGWRSSRFGSLYIWWHRSISDVLCEILHTGNAAIDAVTMRQSMHAVHLGVLKNGGLPLHAALLTRDGNGVVLVAAGGVGKSTCSREVVHPWVALADDAAVIVPTRAGGYSAHPFPTWSEYVMKRSSRTWQVHHGVGLTALFFLEQGLNDQVTPMGQGETALRLNHSASYTCLTGWIGSRGNDRAFLTKRLFDNCCRIAASLPAFTLRARLGGRFWEQINKALPQQTSQRQPD